MEGRGWEGSGAERRGVGCDSHPAVRALDSNRRAHLLTAMPISLDRSRTGAGEIGGACKSFLALPGSNREALCAMLAQTQGTLEDG